MSHSLTKMSASVTSLATLLVCSHFPSPGPVKAQDMVFGMDEASTGRRGRVRGGPPSRVLANAFRMYQRERYEEAAVQLQRVVQGETRDAPANVQKAQFFLGKTLYHLQFYQSALSLFDEISEKRRRHVFFDQTLQWLAQLASQLPESAGIIQKIGRFGMKQLDRFNTPDNFDLYNQLLYLMGRSKYQQGEFRQAIALFERVSRESRWYVQSRFFQGISHIRMRRAKPAIGSFRAILDALERGVEGVEDEERMRDLAWISLARTYYTAATRTTAPSRPP